MGSGSLVRVWTTGIKTSFDAEVFKKEVISMGIYLKNLTEDNFSSYGQILKQDLRMKRIFKLY